MNSRSNKGIGGNRIIVTKDLFMNRDEALNYYRRITGYANASKEDIKELRDDFRLSHILVHNCGIVPEGVDEDDFFEKVLDTLDE